MNIETLKELQKGITQGKWRVSPSGILICTADETAPHVNICLIEDKGDDALAPLPNEVWSNAKAIGLVPELIEEVIKLRGLVKHVIECADNPDNQDPKDFVWSLDFEGLRDALK